MKSLRFGIEIETIGETRETVARAICSVVGGTVRHDTFNTGYDPWLVNDNTGRTWKVVTDASLSAERSRQAEVVSPILTWDDIESLQNVVRAIRHVGARVDASCGIHLHVDASRFDPRAITNLVKIVNKQERLIEHALGVSEARTQRWCRGIDQDFLRRIETSRPRTLDALNIAWYGSLNRHPQHYDSTRYRGVNLHNVWFRGTVEFRWFEATLHAGKVKAYVQFVLALAAKALNARAASSARRDFDPETAKYDFRVLMIHLGLIGDEFKTARLHLMEHLKGSAAWKHGRPAARCAA